MEEKKEPKKTQRKFDECQEHMNRQLNSSEGISSRVMPLTQSGMSVREGKKAQETGNADNRKQTRYSKNGTDHESSLISSTCR